MLLKTYEGAGKTEHFLHVITSGSPYVAVDKNSIVDREDLWEQLRQSLLEEVAKRRVTKRTRRKGRPARGPGSGILRTDSEGVARQMYDAYTNASARLHRAPRFVEVARELDVSTTVVWRWRQKNAWPPEEPTL